MTAGGVDVLQVLPVTLIADRAETLVHHDFGKTDDGIKRCANFMTDLREKFGFGDRGFLGCLLGVRELFGGVLPRGNVAQYHAQLLSALNATHSDVKRNQPSLAHTSDRLVTGDEATRATAVCEPVEVLERQASAFRRQ